MDIKHHWLEEAERIVSPNSDERPNPGDISLLVIHCISLPPEQFGGPYINQLFLNRLDPQQHPYFAEIHALRVSAHVLIRRNGSLTQFVPFDRRAWHAGLSCYRGRERCNDFSIGIELEGSVNRRFADRQYDSLIELSKAIMASYPAIGKQNIAGHSDIAPGRKQDPGPFFDWPRYLSGLDRA
ncbi:MULTISPECIES: 1,6-anhydro-N-acetylmuramyl-L-alanine amidase AmpD [Methylomonas]|uniref:1,6-anhydro-N-acetylmuramyl-L-alanine amidase AmpD n=1 Tax=Methylomonas TaxID=416 RepID=UPI001232A58D|nr:1,6-anhydro-N-acetylmuramyl-L-alanine amidase AmpD [Methylomonas rhizoryzae]